MHTLTVVRFCKYILVFVLFSQLLACATYRKQASSMRGALISGQYDAAFKMIDEKQSSDVVLSNMNKGMILRLKGDYAGSNRLFELAKIRIGELYGVSVTEQLGSVAINDAIVEFSGSRYEQLLLHAYMAMNYIDLNDLDAARVEMLQADVKMREWGEQPDDDPFLRYLSGMIYEALGEYDQALVSYRYAIKAYKTHQEKQGLAIPTSLLKDTVRLLKHQGMDDDVKILLTENEMPTLQPSKPGKSDGEVVIILNNGLSPVKTENRITKFADELSKTVHIALPSYLPNSQAVNTVQMAIDGQHINLERVENIDGLARSTLEDEMPLIITRAIARAVVKHASQKQAGENHALGGLFMKITNLATERADTRSWVTLPQEIQMSRHVLPQGEHKLTIDVLSSTGQVIDRLTETISITPGKITFFVKHWFAPKPVVKPQPMKKTSLNCDMNQQCRGLSNA